MPRRSRTLLQAIRLLAAAAVGAFVFAGLLAAGLVLGGADCHQGRCNRFGELIDDSAPLYPVLAALAGLLAAWAVARPVRRR